MDTMDAADCGEDVDQDKLYKVKSLCMKFFGTENTECFNTGKIQREMSLIQAKTITWQPFGEKYSAEDFKKILTSHK